MQKNPFPLIGTLPKIGIRPTIDGRRKGVRESLEGQVMAMAKNAAKFLSANLHYPNGKPVDCVIADSCIGGVAEAALRDAAEQLHLSALEHHRGLLGAGAGPLALGAARGGLAVAAAYAAADPLLLLVLVYADMDGGQVHYRVTPRRRNVEVRM